MLVDDCIERAGLYRSTIHDYRLLGALPAPGAGPAFRSRYVSILHSIWYPREIHFPEIEGANLTPSGRRRARRSRPRANRARAISQANTAWPERGNEPGRLGDPGQRLCPRGYLPAWPPGG